MRTTVKMYSVMLAVAISAASCKKDTQQVPPTPTTTNTTEEMEARTYMDLAYGDDKAQRMDVYLPAGRTSSTPVIVLLHGGGFIAGDKTEFTTQAKQLHSEGYVVLNVNYRLVDSTGVLRTPMVHKPSAVKIADQLNDIKTAIGFAAAKSGEWIMSETQWAITGHSAGATLALLYGYGDPNADKRIKVAGNWAGATTFAFTDESEADLLDPRLVEVLYRAIGAELKNENKLAYMAASPFWVANLHGGIPTVNVRAEHNDLFGANGDKESYEKLTELLNSKSVANKYIEVAGADHGFSKPGNWDKVLNETDAFFSIYIK